MKEDLQLTDKVYKAIKEFDYMFGVFLLPKDIGYTPIGNMNDKQLTRLLSLLTLTNDNEFFCRRYKGMPTKVFSDITDCKQYYSDNNDSEKSNITYEKVTIKDGYLFDDGTLTLLVSSIDNSYVGKHLVDIEDSELLEILIKERTC